MTNKEALRKLILDDFTPINDLVYRKGNNVQIAKPMYLGASPEDCYNIIEKDLDKLNQLEDIEKELGVDLITLFKVLKQGYIYTLFDFKIRIIGIDYNTGYLLSYDADNQNVFEIYAINAYGRTWALTKEELE